MITKESVAMMGMIRNGFRQMFGRGPQQFTKAKFKGPRATPGSPKPAFKASPGPESAAPKKPPGTSLGRKLMMPAATLATGMGIGAYGATRINQVPKPGAQPAAYGAYPPAGQMGQPSW